MNKPKSIFQLLSCLTDKKTAWEDLTDADRKNFSVYMVNRFISMDMDLIFLVNYLQTYNMAGMQPREAYKVYLDLLPKKKMWSKYIKATGTDKNSLNDKLVKLFAEFYEWPINETEDNLKLILKTKEGRDIIKEQISKFGYEPKQYGIK